MLNHLTALISKDKPAPALWQELLELQGCLNDDSLITYQKTLLCGWYRCKGLPEKNHAANLERQGFITVKAKEEKSVLSRGFQKCRPWYAKLYRRTVGAWRLQITSSKKAAAERYGVERRGENKSKC
ncbi:uncharacterized protein LOC112566413 [Pomacea canaliculata]|uniref:uncharacterized protein LOC112566413 n=1 Tax=Pomacea canaliculata TaxID=400727 RepID=UPI000D72D427|nr:uncharacterized protein LOC112566413 [Pomacea canaliculata]